MQLTCAGTGHIRRALAGRGGVERLREFDRSEAMLAASEAEEKATAAALMLMVAARMPMMASHRCR